MSYHRHTYYSDYADKPSWLYRLYDAEGGLLYVGITINPEGRIPKHRGRPWGGLIADYTLEEHPNREAAKAAERSAIHHERPLHNLNRPRMECC